MKLLIHICCLPCFLHPCELIIQSKITWAGFFYNPNIFPDCEYNKRFDAVKKYFSDNDFVLKTKEWTEKDREFYQKGKNCAQCFYHRLEKTFITAAEEGFSTVTTTLLSSIYQPRELLIETGKILEKKYGISFIFPDYRLGYYESRNIARNSEIYQQKYCGCETGINKYSPAVNDLVLSTVCTGNQDRT